MLLTIIEIFMINDALLGFWIEKLAVYGDWEDYYFLND